MNKEFFFRKICLPIYALSILGLPASLLAMGDMPPIEEMVKSPKDNFPSLDDLSGTKIEKAKDDYLLKRNMKEGYGDNANGRYYVGWSTATIDKSTEAVDWPDAKIMAFEIALTKAKSDYIKLQNKVIATESAYKFFKDERPFDPNKVAAEVTKIDGIINKIEALADAELDAALTERGVDPKQFDVAKKRKLLEESFQKNATIQAYGQVAGITILRTFEDDGSVGVLFVVSDKLKQAAKDLLHGTGVAKNGPPTGKSIEAALSEQCPKDECYITMDGVRLMKDEYENDVIVSFASSGVKATKNTSKLMLDKSVEAAKSIAQQLASARLSEFANASLNFEAKSEQMKSATATQSTSKDGFVEDIESMDVGKMVSELSKERSSLTVKGETIIKRWTAKHPQTGHIITGVVSVWSPLTQANSTLKAAPAASTSGSDQPGKKLEVRESADVKATF